MDKAANKARKKQVGEGEEMGGDGKMGKWEKGK